MSKPNPSKHIYFLFFGWMCCAIGTAQLDTYEFERELTGITDQWHSIALPNAVFASLNPEMSDLRIYGVTENDTLEAPFIWRIAKGSRTHKEVDFNLLNRVSNTNGHYFTYEIPTTEAINQIHLNFENQNFDWRVRLEGSQSQGEWYTISEDYRILSIKTDKTDYSFTDLSFSKSKYRYYRVLVKSNEKPRLKSASVRLDAKVAATYEDYPVTYLNIDRQDKRTIIDIDLHKRLPVSYLQFNVDDDFDYYRPISLQYVYDSVITEKGTRYNYANLTSGTLTSLEDNRFTFPTTLARRFRAVIENDDNQPLHIETVIAKGFEHRLIARFTQPATYYLAYGKKRAQRPQYDISRAAAKIPASPSPLVLGREIRIPKNKAQSTAPLFTSKLWLWGIMMVIISVLGWFTWRMMRGK